MAIAARPFLTLPVLADAAERAVVAAFFGYFAFNILRAFVAEGGVDMLLLLVSEASIVFFILVRRHKGEMSTRPADWVLALAGSVAPLLARPGAQEALAPFAVCVGLMLVGFAVQIAAKFTLRRSFGTVAANRGVKVGGPYRLVRHPMYAGYLVTQVGFMLAHPTLWNLSVYAVALAFQVARILAEERILARDPAYRDFCATVRWRLLPGLF